MADRPLHPALNETASTALAEYCAGRISAEVALMRLSLSGLPAAEIPGILRDAPELSAFARRHAGGLAVLERMVRDGAEHAQGVSLAATREMWQEAAEPGIEGRKRGGEARHVAAVAENGVEIHQIGEDQALFRGRP